jgi:hypothetical protein
MVQIVPLTGSDFCALPDGLSLQPYKASLVLPDSCISAAGNRCDSLTSAEKHFRDRPPREGKCLSPVFALASPWKRHLRLLGSTDDSLSLQHVLVSGI